MRSAFNRVRARSIGVEKDIYEEEGGLLSDGEVAKALGLKSRQSVQIYRDAGKIFAVPAGKRSYQYPAWQVHKGATLPGLADVLAVLTAKQISPMGVALFFLTQTDSLNGKSPLETLRKRKSKEVIKHAERYGEMGA